MRFQVKDLMSNVFPTEMAENPCAGDSTRDHGCTPGPPGCPPPSQRPPKRAMEMLTVLRGQMRQALLPA